MAYDEKLAGRIRAQLEGKRDIAEKRMFGGIAFLLKGKMCCGVLNADLVARVGAEDYGKALMQRHARPMNFTGRPIRGFVYVGPGGTRTARDLRRWLDRCLLLWGKSGEVGRAGAARTSPPSASGSPRKKSFTAKDANPRRKKKTSPRRNQ